MSLNMLVHSVVHMLTVGLVLAMGDENCSEDLCISRHVSALSGQDVSLVCSGDCLTFPAWCTREHDGSAFPKDRLFSLSWLKDGEEVVTDGSDCHFTNCSGFHFELEGRSLILANVTAAMSGSYACVVHFWRNNSCCDDIPNKSNITVQQVCNMSIVNFTGIFSLSINASGEPFSWTYKQPVYPWVLSSIIFGNQSSIPLVSTMGLSVQEHRISNHLKNSNWKTNHTGMWYVAYAYRKEDRELVVYKILQPGEDVVLSCLPDCGYPMPWSPVWSFAPYAKREYSDISLYRSPDQSFLQRRWHILLSNVSTGLASSRLGCQLNNSVDELSLYPTGYSIGAAQVDIYLEVNDSSENSGFGWAPSVPKVPHEVHYINQGEKPELCIEVMHNPQHGRLVTGCYKMQTKCSPFCKFFRQVIRKRTAVTENATDGLKIYRVCWDLFFAVLQNCSFVYEAYQLRNPRKVTYHTVDYRVLVREYKKHRDEKSSPNMAGAIGGGVIIVLVIAVLLFVYYCKKKIRVATPIVLHCDTNPMYGQVEDDSVMGSPRSATTEFSFLRDGSERRLTPQCPSVEQGKPFYIEPWDDWEVSKNRVHIERIIGAGEFGEVFQGKLMQGDGYIDVAIKKTREDTTSKEVSDLKSELKLLKEITGAGGHANVIRLIGSCTVEEPLMVLTEYAANGDLKNYVIANKMKHLDMPKYERDKLFIGYCMDVANGMVYLSSQKIVHRDLAARNVLVFDDCTLKITDFGLTKYLTDKPYYRVCNHTLLPVKWMAPECILNKKFTQMSDVWSYGVVVWEVCSHGETPYKNTMEQGDLLQQLTSGQVLQPPADSPHILKNLMESTWQLDPDLRPTFEMIFQKLTEFVKEKQNGAMCENINACQKFEKFQRTN